LSLFFFAFALAFYSCDTEVELLAPYDSTPVIVGVLNPAVDTQFVRINKTFLGEGDATTYAAIKDSVEYPLGSVDARLYKYQNNNLQDSIILQAIDIPSREPGAFYDTDVRFYFTDQPLFTSSELNNLEDMRYVLRVNTPDGNFTAETNFPDISNSTIQIPPPIAPGQDPSKLNFTAGFANNYTSVNFQYDNVQNAARYNGIVRLNFDASLSDGTFLENRSLDYNIGTNQSQSSSGSDDFSMNSELWYEFINRELAEIEGLRKVRIENLEFILRSGNEELDRYIEVARPVSQFTPVLTSYTNISGGAIGIFGGVAEASRIFWLRENSLEVLNDGEYNVENYCYCVQDWPGSVYVCTEPAVNCP
jgi:hypothetical protein